MNKKEQLNEQLKEIENEERKKSIEKTKKENYQKFKNRYSDWVIGKAHADINLNCINYNCGEKKYTIGECISIHGNCGSSYNAEAQITSDTNSYFHNVWTNKQQNKFQKKMNKIALQEITKIMNKLPQKLEILELQSTKFYLENLYPKNKIKIIKEEIKNEIVKILDKYPDKDFLNLTDNTSYGDNILTEYIKNNRKHLIGKMAYDKKKCYKNQNIYILKHIIY